MKENDNFCGYVCGNEIDKQQEIIDELVVFSRYNPEWAVIMLGKFMQMLYDARQELIGRQPRDKEERDLGLLT